MDAPRRSSLNDTEAEIGISTDTKDLGQLSIREHPSPPGRLKRERGHVHFRVAKVSQSLARLGESQRWLSLYGYVQKCKSSGLTRHPTAGRLRSLSVAAGYRASENAQ
jgi:hypothetical protein